MFNNYIGILDTFSSYDNLLGLVADNVKTEGRLFSQFAVISGHFANVVGVQLLELRRPLILRRPLAI